MATVPNQPTFNIDPDEKCASVMVYTSERLCWGNVVLKQSVRASTWLRTPAIPRFIELHDAQALRIAPGREMKPAPAVMLFIPSAQVIAFHLKPPAVDPLDYDVNEPMRKMEPASALVGDFRFDGSIRMSVQSDLGRFLDVSKETFIGMYDLTVSLPGQVSFGKMHVPFGLLRGESVLFSVR